VLIPLWIERTGRETNEYRKVQQQRKVSPWRPTEANSIVTSRCQSRVQSKAIVAFPPSMPDRSDERKRSRTDSDSEVDDPFSNRRDRKIAASEAMDSTSNKPSKKSRSLVPGSSNGAVAPGSHAATAASIARFHDICNLDDSVDLPDYVKQHANTLTFPEKVSRLAVQMCDVLQLWTVSFVSNLLLLIPGAANADAHAC